MSDSETELRQLVDALPQYEDQIRYWDSQLQAISDVRADIAQAQETLICLLTGIRTEVFVVSSSLNCSLVEEITLT